MARGADIDGEISTEEAAGGGIFNGTGGETQMSPETVILYPKSLVKVTQTKTRCFATKPTKPKPHDRAKRL